MKYHVIIFGCQMNKSDAERVAGVLESQKYKQTSNINEADLIAVVMCSVRQSAVDRVHGLVEKFRKLKTTNYKLQTILAGCILKKDKKIFVDGFDYVLGIKDIKKIPQIIKNTSNHNLRDRVKNDLTESNYLSVVPKYENKFSANVPIMTGCNNFCSYCVVPYTREGEVSRSVKEIISEIKKLVKNGYKEIWLLGQNVNSYKGNYSNVLKNTRIVNFTELLKLINDIPGNFWIRFTSSHPKDFNEDVIGAMAEGRHITPYLNLPVQSGDDKVLRSMNRRYTVTEYKNKIKKIRRAIPGIAISTDIIVGFPGETKKQFLNTAKLFREVKYDMAYINKYSARAGTAASKLKDNVSKEEKKNREKILTDILKQTSMARNKKLIGKETIVLFNESRDGNYFGKEEYYKTIKVKSNKNLLGKMARVKITEARPFILIGEIINE